MKHVHDRKILHRDLKSQNIFLNKNGWIKLGDFGIAKVLEHTKDIAKTVVGTPYYLSPEIIENKPYSFNSDIWSLGVLLYEMCTLRPPFDANSLHELASKILKGKYPPIPKHYSENLQTLVKTLLNIEPRRRPNVNQILKFPLISEKIPSFLDDSVFKDEFSHTIIHNKKFFDADGNPIKQPVMPVIPEEDPTQAQYKNYVNYINKCISKETDDAYVDSNMYAGVAGSGTGDREDDEEESKDAGSDRSSMSSAPSNPDTYNFDEVDFNKFSAFMINKFGQTAFEQGWMIMQKHKGSRFAGDTDLTGYLRGILATEKEATEFVSLCSTYMILENYASQMAARH